MRADDLREFLRAEPFVPFRLHITTGKHVDVMHPELAWVTRSLVAVGAPDEDGEIAYKGHYNLLHIAEVELLPKAKKAGRNGRGRKKR